MRRIIVTCAAAAALIATLAAADNKIKAVKTGPAPSYGNADAIDQDELRIYEYFLASDQLEGRNFPSRGYDTAALYVAGHLAEWGLKPGGSASGTNGPLQPYLMPIEMVSRQVVARESKASLTAPSSGGRGGAASSEPQTTTFEYGREWTAGAAAGFGRRGPAPEAFDASGNLVFAGNGYVISKTGINPYQGLDVRGKLIVVAGLPPELAAQQAAGGRGSRGAPDPLGENCTDYFTPEEYAAKSGALAVVTVAGFQQAAAMSNTNAGGRGGRGGALNGPAFQVKNFRPPAACPSVPAITAGLDLTNQLFQGEKTSGSQVFYAAGSGTRQDSFELNANKKLSLHLAVRSQPGHGENVVGILEGGDPTLKDEYVVMSAHLDHLGLSAPLADGHDVFNGADDDGSGSTGLLGVAHAYAAGAAKGIRPKRSIIFLWVGGEEKGLWGSQYFTEFPPIDLSKVVADLNMDMIGRSRNANSVDSDPTHVLVNPGEVLVIGPRYQQRRSGPDHRHRQRGVSKAHHQSLLRRDGSGCHPRQFGTATAGPAHLLPQRSLQFRQDGNSDCIFHNRFARGLSPPHGHAGQDRLPGAAVDCEDRGRGRMGIGEPERTPQAQYTTSGTVDQGHEGCPERGLGQSDAGAAAAARRTVLARARWGRRFRLPTSHLTTKLAGESACPMSDGFLRSRHHCLKCLALGSVGVVRGAHNRHQLARIQPVELAARAIVDHDIARAAIIVRIHGLAALRAGNVAAQFLGVGRVRDARRDSLQLRPQVARPGRKLQHRNEAAVAMGAI